MDQDAMAPALEEASRLLRPDGTVIDIHPVALFGCEQPARDLHEVRPDHGDPNQWYEDQDPLDKAIPTGDELGTENDQ
jgi:hypothetical protein